MIVLLTTLDSLVLWSLTSFTKSSPDIARAQIGQNGSNITVGNLDTDHDRLSRLCHHFPKIIAATFESQPIQVASLFADAMLWWT